MDLKNLPKIPQNPPMYFLVFPYWRLDMEVLKMTVW